jgi:hypothetical protein
VYINKGTRYREQIDLGKVAKRFQKGRQFLRLGEKISRMDFHKTWKELKKGVGGCGSAVRLSLKCLCKVLDLKGNVVYNFCVSLVNFGEVGLDKLE